MDKNTTIHEKKTLICCQRNPSSFISLNKCMKLREAAKSSTLNGRAIKEKRTFFVTFFYNVPKFRRPLSSRRGGG